MKISLFSFPPLCVPPPPFSFDLSPTGTAEKLPGNLPVLYCTGTGTGMCPGSPRCLFTGSFWSYS